MFTLQVKKTLIIFKKNLQVVQRFVGYFVDKQTRNQPKRTEQKNF